MTNRELEVILTLRDELSKKLESAKTAIAKFASEMGKMGRLFTSIGRDLNRIGSQLTIFGAAITGGFLLSLRNMVNYSPQVSRAFTELTNAARNFQLVIAQAVVPILQRLANFVSGLVEVFQSLNPQLRDQILQWVFLSGIWLTAVGILFKVAGGISTLFGKIFDLIKIMANLARANLPVAIGIAAISLAITALIMHWEELRAKAIPVINAMQIGADMVAIGFLKVVDAVLTMDQWFTKLLLKLKPIIDLGMKLHLIGKDIGASWENALDGMNENVIEARSKLQTAIGNIEKDMERVMETGKGAWAKTVDDSITKFKEFIRMLKVLTHTGFTSAKEEIFQWGKFTSDVITRIAQQMEYHLGNFFYNVLTRQVTSAKEMFADFGRSILQILTQALAKLILFFTIGKALESTLGFNMFKFHQGGIVRRAHTGMLASDEVPIIAQTGEGILSRRGMSALGRNNFDSLNRGERAGGGVNITIAPVIQAWDSRDIYRNREQIIGIMNEAIRNNTTLRKVMRDYA
ncbi:MAG: hypothetical protein PHO42_06390 [Candidatus Omnitrophica bacterium]|nr:hypothetical protein [Candidatus Omnitrophota bacterium]